MIFFSQMLKTKLQFLLSFSLIPRKPIIQTTFLAANQTYYAKYRGKGFFTTIFVTVRNSVLF